LPAQLEKSGDRRADGCQIAAAFGHEARHRLFVPGDDNLFTPGDPFQELTKPGLGFQGSNAFHNFVSVKLTSH
jgi:hypothetical protein